MNNLFDSDNYPDEVPGELAPGRRWAWKRSDITEAYPTASYSLRFNLKQLDSPNDEYEIDAGKVSSEHVVEVASTANTGYAAGSYSWRAVVTRDSDSAEIEVDRGFLEISGGVSWVYEVLEQLRINLKARASSGEAAYGIGGRSITWRTYDELIALEKEFSRRWEREKRDADRMAGRGSTRQVLAKLSA